MKDHWEEVRANERKEKNKLFDQKLNRMVQYGKSHTEEEFLTYYLGEELSPVAYAYKESFKQELTTTILKKYGM